MRVTARRPLVAAATRVVVNEIVPAAEQALARYWQEHPEQQQAEAKDAGVDPLERPKDYWPVELAEPAHADIADAVRQNSGTLTLPLAERWMSEEDHEAGGGPPEPAEGTSIEDVLALAAMPLVLYPDDKDIHGIPVSVHYRQAEACVTCFYFHDDGTDAGFCRMFNTSVEPEYICDEWTTKPAEDA